MKVEWLLRLYPRAWRGRYEDEFRALLEQHHVTVVTFLDVLLGALDAHLFPQLEAGRILNMTARIRTAVIMVLWGWVGFYPAGHHVYSLMFSSPFMAATQMNPATAIAYTFVVVGVMVSFLAVAAGGIPVAWSALASAIKGRRIGILILAALPILLMLAAWEVTAWLVRILPLVGRGQATLPEIGPIRLTAAGILGLLWTGGALAGTFAITLVTVKSSIGERIFRWTLNCAVAATLAMVVALGATLLWGLGLRYVPGALRSLNVSEANLVAAWTRVVVQMGLFAGLSVWGVVRGLREGSRHAA